MFDRYLVGNPSKYLGTTYHVVAKDEDLFSITAYLDGGILPAVRTIIQL